MIGEPDPSEGEVPIAFVTLKREVAEKAIQDFIRPFLKPWEMPVKIIVLEQMPFIQGRKVDRQALKRTSSYKCRIDGAKNRVRSGIS